MRKIIFMFIMMLVAVVVSDSGAMVQGIKPLGPSIGQDEAGNAIYQVHANGILIGYKLIDSGEPLVMIAGTTN